MQNHIKQNRSIDQIGAQLPNSLRNTMAAMAHEGEARAVADDPPLLGGRHLRQKGHRGRASHADGQAQADPESSPMGPTTDPLDEGRLWRLGRFRRSGRCNIL